MTIPAQPEPSDADRFATRPKQRKAEVTNATDNKLRGLRTKVRAQAMAALAVPTKAQLKNGEWELLLHVPGNRTEAVWLLTKGEGGLFEQAKADDRTLDPETVDEQFGDAKERHETDIRRRAVLAQHGIRST
jgi:hypothetical protein